MYIMYLLRKIYFKIVKTKMKIEARAMETFRNALTTRRHSPILYCLQLYNIYKEKLKISLNIIQKLAGTSWGVEKVRRIHFVLLQQP